MADRLTICMLFYQPFYHHGNGLLPLPAKKAWSRDSQLHFLVGYEGPKTAQIDDQDTITSMYFEADHAKHEWPGRPDLPHKPIQNPGLWAHKSVAKKQRQNS